jgi:spore germination protein YaaH
MDESNGPAVPGVVEGGQVTPLQHPVDHFSADLTSGAVASTASGAATGSLTESGAAGGGPEVFGFVQNGEVMNADWQADLQFNLLSTIAYFAIDVNPDGSLIETNAGWQGWTSLQATNLFNAAHAAGDRVVATFAYLCGDAGCTNGMNGLLTSSTAETTFVSNVVSQVTSRGVDGVNIDFEPTAVNESGYAQDFTSLMSKLATALPAGDELSVDTYASAYQGGELWNISALAPVVSAIDVMTYGLYSGPPDAQPNDPLAGPYPYTDTSVVNGYLGEMPASKLILGIPYYGVTDSTTATTFGAPLASPPNVTNPYYSAIQYEFSSCALPGLTESYDTTSQTAWASWGSPPNSNCNNYGTLRELYYDTTQSLEAKYQLVNVDGLRGIGIWALGMDSGSDDYWNAIAGGFDAGAGYSLDAYGGVHPFGDAPPVTITGYWPGWQIATSIVMDPCDTTGQYSGWVMDGFGGLHPFAAAGTPMPAVPDITGYWPGWAIANDVAAFCITVGGVQHAAGCVLDGFGGLHPWADSSAVIGDVPCTGTGYWPNWDIATKIAVVPGHDYGYVMDGFGGLHPFNGAPYYAPSGYWPGWTIARGIVATASGGYTVDGFGGIHAFGNAPAITPTGYWPNWDIVRGIAVGSEGTGVETLDGFGGVHPAGGAPFLSVSGYFPNQDIVVGIVTAS